jgi:hypothetical protein
VIAIRAGSRVMIASRTQAGMQPLATLTRSEWDGRGFSEVLAQDAPDVDAPEDVLEVEA